MDAVAATAREAEQLGYDAVWLPDSQLLWRDVWVTAGFVAAATKQIQIGTAVTNLETRHPTVTASAARTVGEVAPGRLVLGLGSGDSSLSLIGTRRTGPSRMRDGIDLIRSLLDGDDRALGGGFGRLRDARGACPIYLAASGPSSLSLAGEIADGVILLGGVSEAGLSRSLATVRDGARGVERPMRSLRVVVAAFAHVTDDVARDSRMLKPLCAALSVAGGADVLTAAGVEVEPLPSRVARVYPDLLHAEDWELAVRVVDEYISDASALRFAESFCLFGSGQTVRERVEELAALGVTDVLVQQIGSYELPHELMRAFADAMDMTPVRSLGG